MTVRWPGLGKVVKRGHRWCVVSPRNPDWSGGCYRTKKEAEKRLRQVERAKHAKGVGGIVKDYIKRVRSMRRLEDQANMAMAKGDRDAAEELLWMAQREGGYARDIHENMTWEERTRARGKLRSSHVLAGPIRRRR